MKKMNIILLHLSPKLNPIDQVWRIIKKKESSANFIESEEFLLSDFEKAVL
jgi:transposase